MKRPDKREIINWEKKSDSDDERISKKLNGRTENTDKSNPKIASKPQITTPVTPGAAPIKVRPKIKEVYDDEDEEDDDIVNAPFFNITLIEDDEQELKKAEIKEKETLSITKEQQLISKLNIVMNTALDAEEIGLSSKLTQKDFNRINDAEYNPNALKRKTAEDKIEKPIKEERSTLDTLKKLAEDCPDDSLDSVLTENLEDLQPSQEEMAKLILKKSGRTKSKKNILEIMVESEDIKRALTSTHDKE